MAILLQYLRIFEKGSKSRTLTHILLVINVIWGIAYTFLAWVPCIPVAAYWDWTIPDRGRWAYGTQTAEVLIRTYESHATSNMILDFVIFAIPLPLYFNNNANRKSRKGVLGLFILGSVYVDLQLSAVADCANANLAVQCLDALHLATCLIDWLSSRNIPDSRRNMVRTGADGPRNPRNRSRRYLRFSARFLAHVAKGNGPDLCDA